MRRKLFTIAWCVSLLLCITVGALWHRSFTTWEDYEVRTVAGREYSIRGYDGEVELRFARGLETGKSWTSHGRGGRPKPLDWSKLPPDAVGVLGEEEMFWRQDYIWTPVRHFSWWGFRGYEADYLNGYLPGRCWSVTIPSWFFAATTLVLPCVAVLKRVFRRRRPWRCPTCSYDLTGNTSGVCPECGSQLVGKQWA